MSPNNKADSSWFSNLFRIFKSSSKPRDSDSSRPTKKRSNSVPHTPRRASSATELKTKHTNTDTISPGKNRHAKNLRSVSSTISKYSPQSLRTHSVSHSGYNNNTANNFHSTINNGAPLLSLDTDPFPPKSLDPSATTTTTQTPAAGSSDDFGINFSGLEFQSSLDPSVSVFKRPSALSLSSSLSPTQHNTEEATATTLNTSLSKDGSSSIDVNTKTVSETGESEDTTATSKLDFLPLDVGGVDNGLDGMFLTDVLGDVPLGLITAIQEEEDEAAETAAEEARKVAEKKAAEIKLAAEIAKKRADEKAAAEAEAAKKLAEEKAAAAAAAEAAKKLEEEKAAAEAAKKLAEEAAAAAAAAEAAKKLEEEKAAAEAAKKLAEEKAAEELAKKLAEEKAAEEAAAKKLAEEKAAEEAAAKKLAEEKVAEEAAKKLAEEKAAEEAAARAAEEAALKAAEKKIADEEKALLAEMAAAEELKKVEIKQQANDIEDSALSAPEIDTERPEMGKAISASSTDNLTNLESESKESAAVHNDQSEISLNDSDSEDLVGADFTSATTATVSSVNTTLVESEDEQSAKGDAKILSQSNDIYTQDVEELNEETETDIILKGAEQPTTHEDSKELISESLESAQTDFNLDNDLGTKDLTNTDHTDKSVTEEFPATEDTLISESDVFSSNDTEAQDLTIGSSSDKENTPTLPTTDENLILSEPAGKATKHDKSTKQRNRKKSSTKAELKKDAITPEPLKPKLIDDNQPEVFLYTSFASGTHHMVPDTRRIAQILECSNIKFTYVDLATNPRAKRIWKWRSKERRLPGVVRDDEVIADLKELEKLNEVGQVYEKVIAEDLY